MKKVRDVGYTQYRDGEFIIDIYEYTDKWEVWLRKDQICSALYMFGFFKDITPREEVLRMVANELEFFEDTYDDWLLKRIEEGLW